MIIQMPCNNFNTDSGPKAYIVIHGTAGGSSAEGIARFFIGTEGGSNPVASHYIVGRDGVVVQCVQEKDGAWANGSVLWNNRAISIEHVKPSTDNSDQLSPIQKSTSFALIKAIIGRNPMITPQHIVPHSAVFSTACPGPYPFTELMDFLTGSTPIMPDANMVRAAYLAWGSFFSGNLTRPVPDINSGIANLWLQDYYTGVFHGPPITPEYNTVNWQGVMVKAQDFTGGTYTWSNGAGTWYPCQ